MKPTNEQIEELKNNLAEFRFMPKTLSDRATAIGRGQFEILFPNGTFQKGSSVVFDPKGVFRLRKDYTPEPDIVECEIKWEDDGRGYARKKSIDCWMGHKQFIGFKFEDGTWCELPIMPVDGQVFNGIVDISQIVDGTITVLHATHVVFRKTK